jgi:hypothetical protein
MLTSNIFIKRVSVETPSLARWTSFGTLPLVRLFLKMREIECRRKIRQSKFRPTNSIGAPSTL